MNDDDSSVDVDGDSAGITIMIWATIERGRTTRWLRMIIRMMMWETLTIPICATGRRWGRERMTTWLTTLEEESWGTENKGTAVNKYTCGGGLSFLGQFFFVLPLLDASITSSFFNMFVFQVSDNLNILFSSEKSFIGKKPQLSIIK